MAFTEAPRPPPIQPTIESLIKALGQSRRPRRTCLPPPPADSLVRPPAAAESGGCASSHTGVAGGKRHKPAAGLTPEAEARRRAAVAAVARTVARRRAACLILFVDAVLEITQRNSPDSSFPARDLLRAVQATNPDFLRHAHSRRSTTADFVELLSMLGDAVGRTAHLTHTYSHLHAHFLYYKQTKQTNNTNLSHQKHSFHAQFRDGTWRQQELPSRRTNEQRRVAGLAGAIFGGSFFYLEEVSECGKEHVSVVAKNVADVLNVKCSEALITSPREDTSLASHLVQNHLNPPAHRSFYNSEEAYHANIYLRQCDLCQKRVEVLRTRWQIVAPAPKVLFLRIAPPSAWYGGGGDLFNTDVHDFGNADVMIPTSGSGDKNAAYKLVAAVYFREGHFTCGARTRTGCAYHDGDFYETSTHTNVRTITRVQEYTRTSGFKVAALFFVRSDVFTAVSGGPVPARRVRGLTWFDNNCYISSLLTALAYVSVFFHAEVDAAAAADDADAGAGAADDDADADADADDDADDADAVDLSNNDDDDDDDDDDENGLNGGGWSDCDFD